RGPAPGGDVPFSVRPGLRRALLVRAQRGGARAAPAGVPCALIVDAGVTEFRGAPTKTCCAVGPAWTDAVDAITGALPLL
ncbi:MAG: hypothetical protein H7138_09180, partial [Myxococcales bacterium]|nr:hypothetical protein [Myxococcales bacterium]